MILLHKLGGQEVMVNADLIETLEPGPQTVVNLATGNRLLVRESGDEIAAKVLEYKKALHGGGKPVNPIQSYQRESA